MFFIPRYLSLVALLLLLKGFPATAQLENRAVTNFPPLGAKMNGVKEKAAKAHDLYVPKKNLPNTPFRYLTLADSFSLYKDSMNASLYLLKASPYHLIYLGQTAKTIDTFLSKLCLTIDAKKQFREQFINVYEAKASDAYNTFRDMYRETIKLKRTLDTCPANMKDYQEDQIRIADSAHFVYLFNYVNKHSWPDMQDGGLYAGYIAIRDVEHYFDYIPHVYKAFMAGQLPINITKAIFENDRTAYVNYIIFKEYMKGDHAIFDVSSMLSGDMPSSAPAIIAAMKAHCPVKEIFYVSYSNKRRIFWSDWMPKFGKPFEKAVWEFQDNIFANCPQIHLEQMDRGIGQGIDVLPIPTDRKGDRMLFYIFY